MYVSFYRLLNPKSFVIGSLLKLCIYASYNKHFPQDGTTPLSLPPSSFHNPCRRSRRHRPRHNSQIYDYACFNTVGLNLLCSHYNGEHKFNNNYISFNIKNQKKKLTTNIHNITAAYIEYFLYALTIQ